MFSLVISISEFLRSFGRLGIQHSDISSTPPRSRCMCTPCRRYRRMMARPNQPSPHLEHASTASPFKFRSSSASATLWNRTQNRLIFSTKAVCPGTTAVDLRASHYSIQKWTNAVNWRVVGWFSHILRLCTLLRLPTSPQPDDHYSCSFHKFYF